MQSKTVLLEATRIRLRNKARKAQCGRMFLQLKISYIVYSSQYYSFLLQLDYILFTVYSMSIGFVFINNSAIIAEMQ